MSSIINERIYNMALISKIKEQTSQKKLKKIIKKLRNIAEEDLKESSGLKIKVFAEEKEKTPAIKIAAPIIGFRLYFEDFKKLNSKQAINNINYELENTPSTLNDNEEEVGQVDSSDISEDE